MDRWIAPPAVDVDQAVVAPAAGAVIADTGPLPAGDYYVELELGASGVNAAGKDVSVEHRNAANGANVHTGPLCPYGLAGEWTSERVTLGQDERIRAVQGSAPGSAGERATARIRVYPYG